MAFPIRKFFFGLLSSGQAYTICMFGFIISCVQIVGYYFYRNLRKEHDSDALLRQQGEYQQNLLSISKSKTND